MNKYVKPIIEVLSFDEEEILTTSAAKTSGYDAAKAVTAMMGDDAGYDTGSNTNVSITSVKVTSLGLAD